MNQTYDSHCTTQCGDQGCRCASNESLDNIDHLLLVSRVHGNTLACLCGNSQVSLSAGPGARPPTPHPPHFTISAARAAPRYSQAFHFPGPNIFLYFPYVFLLFSLDACLPTCLPVCLFAFTLSHYVLPNSLQSQSIYLLSFSSTPAFLPTNYFPYFPY
jgi:hypothetical protein